MVWYDDILYDKWKDPKPTDAVHSCRIMTYKGVTVKKWYNECIKVSWNQNLPLLIQCYLNQVWPIVDIKMIHLVHRLHCEKYRQVVMALNSLYCADVPLSNYSLTWCPKFTFDLTLEYFACFFSVPFRGYSISTPCVFFGRGSWPLVLTWIGPDDVGVAPTSFLELPVIDGRFHRSITSRD